MTILGQITLHGRQFRIVDNRRCKRDRLCLDTLEDGSWTRVCRYPDMSDILFWLYLYEKGGVRIEDCKEYRKVLKDRCKNLEKKI